MNALVTPLLVSLTLFVASPAWAHGEETHAKKAGPVVKEQKAWGIAGDARAVRRTIAIAMSDNMRFTPASIEVNQGDTVRLTLTNTGKVMHELVIGTQQELSEHAALMKRFPNMEHEEPYMAHVAPGKTGEIVWTFNRPGDFEFACLLPGHFEAGMVGKILVKASIWSQAMMNTATSRTEPQGLRRRHLAALAAAAWLPGWALAQSATAPAGPLVQVWKDPNCGCCKDWVIYLEKNGFRTQTFDTGNSAIRSRLGMPQKYGSCHTALVAGYVIEGHVPARDIQRLLKEKPQALGLSVPRMPIGSPGMDGPEYGGRKDPYDVLLVTRDGNTTVFQHYS